VHMQHMVLSLCKHSVLVILDHSPIYKVTVPYAAYAQLYPPEDNHLRLKTCRGEYYFMNK